MLSQRYRLMQLRQDRRAALGAWILANINRDADKKAEPFTLEEVVAWLGHGFQAPEEPPQPPTVEEVKDKIVMLNTLYNGQVDGPVADAVAMRTYLED